MLHFEITDKQQERINQWLKVLKPDLILLLKKSILEYDDLAIDDELYVGAIGGELTYIFMPTGIGTVIKVRENVTGQELNLTDYGAW